jgi:hypothetical protein
MKRTLLATTAITLFLGACQVSPKLETRTFALEHMDSFEAGQLIDPYVYGDREGAPGAWSATERGITVRETADNLDQIARVFAEFDVARPDVRLHFQLIQADGFTGRDERIAAVEEELRSIFQFEGYRLAGEAFVSATDGSFVEQGLGADHIVATTIYFVSSGTIRLDEVRLYSYEGGDRLTTTVNIRPGQTLVLGSASRVGEDITLLLTVRAEEVDA